MKDASHQGAGKVVDLRLMKRLPTRRSTVPSMSLIFKSWQNASLEVQRQYSRFAARGILSTSTVELDSPSTQELGNLIVLFLTNSLCRSDIPRSTLYRKLPASYVLVLRVLTWARAASPALSYD